MQGACDSLPGSSIANILIRYIQSLALTTREMVSIAADKIFCPSVCPNGINFMAHKTLFSAHIHKKPCAASFKEIFHLTTAKAYKVRNPQQVRIQERFGFFQVQVNQIDAPRLFLIVGLLLEVQKHLDLPIKNYSNNELYPYQIPARPHKAFSVQVDLN